MLTHVRKIQKGTLIVVAIIIIIAFAFFYSDYSPSGSRSDSGFSVYGASIDQREVSKLANHYNVAMSVGMFDFATFLFGQDRLDRDPSDFIINLKILRRESEKLGIYPTDEEVAEASRNLMIFKVQPWMDRDYIVQNILRPSGFSEADFANLVRDYLRYKKLLEMLEYGTEPLDSEVDKLYIRQFQTITASLATFKREDFEARDYEISAEEIESYYNLNKDFLQSEEIRKVSFVKVPPPAETEDMTNEQKAEARKAFQDKVNEVFLAMTEENPDFQAIAKAHGQKVETIPLFPKSEAPEALVNDIEMIDAIFSPELAVSEVAEPVRAADGGYFIFVVDEIKAPEAMSLEAATPEIKERLTRQKVSEQMEIAAQEARVKILEAMKNGKKLAEAAKDAGVTFGPLPPFSLKTPPAETENAQLIATNAADEAPGELSDVIQAGPQSLLVYVEKKELYKSDEEEARKKTIAGSIAYQDQQRLLRAWFMKKRDLAKPTRPQRTLEQPGIAAN